MNQALKTHSLSNNNQKDVFYEDIYQILKSFIKTYQSLLLIMRDEEQALLLSSLEDLKKTYQDKECLIFKIQKLEKKKQKWIKSVLSSPFIFSSSKDFLSFSDFAFFFRRTKKKDTGRSFSLFACFNQ